MLGINKPAGWWGYWPVVQQPFKVLKKGVLVLVNKAHHRVAGKKDLEHDEKNQLTNSLNIHTQESALNFLILMARLKNIMEVSELRKWQKVGGKLICHSISDF